jgi:hypothetical protein
MSELRDRMIRDMTVRGLAQRTHTTYIAAVVRLAKHYHRSPDQLTNDEVQAYLAHLILERKLSWSTCSQAANAFRFLYHVTLGHARTDFHVPSRSSRRSCRRFSAGKRCGGCSARPRLHAIGCC